MNNIKPTNIKIDFELLVDLLSLLNFNSPLIITTNRCFQKTGSELILSSKMNFEKDPAEKLIYSKFKKAVIQCTEAWERDINDFKNDKKSVFEHLKLKINIEESFKKDFQLPKAIHISNSLRNYCKSIGVEQEFDQSYEIMES